MPKHCKATSCRDSSPHGATLPLPPSAPALPSGANRGCVGYLWWATGEPHATAERRQQRAMMAQIQAWVHEASKMEARQAAKLPQRRLGQTKQPKCLVHRVLNWPALFPEGQRGHS